MLMDTGSTLFVVDAGVATAVDRLPRSHKEFDEAWARDLLFNTPELMPAEEVLPDAGAFLPIATEVPLDQAGIADVLGVTTGGYPVVVETKLWRNPQARREVLAQTIDYVKEIASLDYAWFERLWSERRGENPSLFAAASEAGDSELDEAQFHDRLGRACATGNILGFIVGDGIHHGLAELIAHLGRESSHLRYTLSMLELRCYQLPAGTLAVMPTIVRQVVPIERAHVRIELAAETSGQLKVSSVARPAAPASTPGRRTTLSEDEFWAGLAESVGDEAADDVRKFLDDLQSAEEIELEYKQRAVMVKVADPEDDTSGASVFAFTTDGTAYNTTHGIRQALRWGTPSERVEKAFADYYRRLHEICPKFQRAGIVHLNRRAFVPLDEFADRLNEIGEAIMAIAPLLRTERGESVSREQAKASELRIVARLDGR
jgi:hypothetical protein